ncbi:hypothetical protein GBA52_029045 [Prunus armeniaca]|nr:hypothetical protein GBA52_029045 [Prunus armeniaca]
MDLIHSHHMDILFIFEPRISGGKATSIAQSLGFSNFEIVDATGFSGGLWLLWDATRVHVDILGTSNQSISASVAWPSQSPWLFTAVYASPCGIKRGKLWEYLSFIADNQHLPWLIAGDFNEMLNVNDKLEGAPVCRLKGFRSLFDCNAMVDLGFLGPKFTWNNKKVFERLDRAICNWEWRGLFAEATVRHLPRTKSDHNPIKICLTSCFSASPALRPFRFEAMWLHHEKFNDFIYEAWGPGDGTTVEKTFALIERRKHWNINVFG